jgi:DNA-binding response OmpR family regulator
MTGEPLKQILIAEDDKPARDLLRFALEHERIAIDTAADGPTALKKLASAEYDLLILDMMLPGVSGQEIIREAGRGGKAGPPILVTTGAHIDAGAEKKLLSEPNVAGLLRKPVLIARFRETVYGILKLDPPK